jgi:hypothetical protein
MAAAFQIHNLFNYFLLSHKMPPGTLNFVLVQRLLGLQYEFA